MGSVLEITDTEFEKEVFSADKPVSSIFGRVWCGPCRLVSPSIDWVANTYSDRIKVVKLEVDPNPDAVAKCKVEGVPALRLFKDKKTREIARRRDRQATASDIGGWLSKLSYWLLVIG